MLETVRNFKKRGEDMAINKETHVNASVILPIHIYKLVQQQAKDNKRSASAQMAYAIEKGLEAEKYGMDSKTTAKRKQG